MSDIPKADNTVHIPPTVWMVADVSGTTFTANGSQFRAMRMGDVSVFIVAPANVDLDAETIKLCHSIQPGLYREVVRLEGQQPKDRP